ncbi:hypothetical protein HYS93_02790 [Candidatus Daviesbacteria bacterium]|nr:hypothetical protein [Candidatus Daviesbacteria bacterium]
MDDQEEVVEGELVPHQPEASEDNERDSSDSQSKGQILINMEGLIKNYISSIDKLTEEMKKHKEMLDDIFKNDPTYQEHLEKAKEATKIKNATKQEILKRPDAKELNEKVKSFKSQIKENQASLSDYLQEYARLSGVNEIEGEDGEVREIVYVAKLVKKSFR